MASEQLIRRENKTDEGEIQGDVVPQVTHFESLTVIDSGKPEPAAVVHRVTETVRVEAATDLDLSQHKGTQKQDDQQTTKTQQHYRGTQTAKDEVKTRVDTVGKSKHEEASEKVQERSHLPDVKKPMTRDSTDTMVGAGRKGASYVSEKAMEGKDIAVETGKTAAEYAGKAAGVAKDAALVAGWGAAELVSGTTEGVTESMENLNSGVSRMIEGAAAGAEVAAEKATGFTDTVMEAGKKGRMYIGERATAGKDATIEAGKTTVGVAGQRASELVSDMREGVGESMGSLNAGVAGAVEGTAVAVETVAEKTMELTDTAVEAGKKGANLVGKTVVGGKDMTLQTGKTAADYTRKAAGDMTASLKETMETFDAGVGGAIEDTATVAERVGEKVVGVADTAVDLGKRWVVAGKDTTLGVGKTAAGDAGKAAEVVKDAALVGGLGAVELASDTARGVSESTDTVNMGVGGLVENIVVATEVAAEKAMRLKDTAVDMGRKGAGYGKDVTLEAGRTTAAYLGKGADMAKDAALVGGWSAAELASETAAGVTESMKSVNAGVEGLVENTAVATEAAAKKATKKATELKDVVIDVGKKGVTYGTDVTFEAGKTTSEYVGKGMDVAKDAALVGGWSAAELASGTAAGVTESMEFVNEGVSRLVEGAASAAEGVAEKAFSTMVDVGKKGASYIGETAVAGKDVTLETGRTTVDYVGMAAGVARDAALIGGWSAVKLASDTTKGVSESVENVNTGVAGLVENTAAATELAAEKAVGLKDTVVGMGKTGAGYGRDVSSEAGKTATRYVGTAANVAKDAALVAGWSAAEVASGTAAGVTESMETLNAGVARLVEGTAVAAEAGAEKAIGLKDTVVDMGKKGATNIGEAAVTGKDIALETGRTTAGYVGKAADVAKEAASVGGRGGSNVGDLGAGSGSKPEDVVVKKVEISVDYGEKGKSEKETKKGQKGQSR